MIPSASSRSLRRLERLALVDREVHRRAGRALGVDLLDVPPADPPGDEHEHDGDDHHRPHRPLDGTRLAAAGARPSRTPPASPRGRPPSRSAPRSCVMVRSRRLMACSARRASSHDCNITAAATLSTTRRRASPRIPASIMLRSAVTVVSRSSCVSTGTSTTVASRPASAMAASAADRPCRASSTGARRRPTRPLRRGRCGRSRRGRRGAIASGGRP